MPNLSLLLDRDGTIIEDCHYLRAPEKVRLLPGAALALGRLGTAGHDFFVVSNQSGIGRGYLSHEDFQACQAELAHQLISFALWKQTLYCPHTPEEACQCRKPATGMWEKLRLDFNLHAKHCCMVGDKLEDLAFGVNSGLRLAFLVLSGKGLESYEKLQKASDILIPLPQAGHVLPLPSFLPPQMVQAAVAPFTTQLYVAPGLTEVTDFILENKKSNLDPKPG